jgi:hypothetical protein
MKFVNQILLFEILNNKNSFQGAIQKVMKRTDQEMKYLYNMSLTGLQLLSKWTNSILEL